MGNHQRKDALPCRMQNGVFHWRPSVVLDRQESSKRFMFQWWRTTSWNVRKTFSLLDDYQWRTAGSINLHRSTTSHWGSKSWYHIVCSNNFYSDYSMRMLLHTKGGDSLKKVIPLTRWGPLPWRTHLLRHSDGLAFQLNGVLIPVLNLLSSSI
jgi:hypothetical protein